MSKKVRIALVYDAIYPFVKGGGERRLHEIGKRLAREGYDIHLYGMQFWDGPNTKQHDSMTLHGLMKARPLYTKDGRRSILQAVLFGLASFKLLGAKFDIIDCCGFPYFSLFPAKLAALLHRKPLYATWFEVWGHEYWNKYLGRLGTVGFCVEWLASRLPNRIIAVSQYTKHRLLSELRVKRPVVVSPNCIDWSSIRDGEPSDKKSDIIYAGRIIEHKNLHLMIEALAQLKKAGHTFTCTFIGEGPDKKRLQALAKKHNVHNQINWLGFVEDSKDVYAHMKASKLFVLPSQREGFGIVAVEAHTCGLPVLTYNHPDNAAKHLIERGQNGDLFDSTTQLAEHILKFLTAAEHKAADCIESAKQYDFNQISQIMNAYSIGSKA